MKTVYFLHQSQAEGNYNWEKELSDINSIQPDLVICFCLEEWDANYIFRNLFPELSKWASTHKKTVKVLSSFADSKPLYRRIELEKTFGLYKLLQTFSKHIINADQVVNPRYCNKVFTNYNKNAKYERAVLVDELARRHLLQHGVVTFLNPDRIQPSFKGDVFTRWQHHNGSKLIDEIQIPADTLSLPKNYFNGLIDLVSETDVKPGDHYVTEKTVKPLVTLKPFICLSSPNYHKFLAEEFGIEQYDELFDYSFDQEEDLHKRINMLVDEIERIVQIYNDDFKVAIYNKLLPKLIRNRDRYMDYGKHRKNMMIDTIEHIVNDNYKIHGSQLGVHTFNDIVTMYKKEKWL